MNKTISRVIYISVLIVAVLTGCANPITPDILELNKDEVLPVITITSPEEGSAYGKTIQVTGTVTDSTDESGTSEGIISSLNYSVSAAGIGETSIELTDGEFSFEFTDSTLTGTIIIQLTAVDSNGNSAEKNLTLVYEGNDIPLFKAVPDNKEIVLSWPDVPGDNNDYTVYYTTDGTSPSAKYYHGIINITSEPSEAGIYRYTLDLHDDEALINGNRYCFLLTAEGSSGGETVVNVSGIEEAVPLSDMTLSPVVTAVNSGLQIEWNEIDGAEYYNVYRLAEGETGETRIAYNYNGNSLIDQSVSNGILYSYSIEPAMDNSVRSGAGCCIASSISSSTTSGFKRTKGDANAAAVSDGYVFVADGQDSETGTALLTVYKLNNGKDASYVTKLLMPVPSGNDDPDYSAEDIIISDDIAYIRTKSWDNGYRVNLWSVDISPPTSPSTIDTWIPPITGYSSQQYLAHYKDGATDYIYFAKNADSPALYKISTTDGSLSGEITYTGPGGSFNFIGVVDDYLVSYMMGGTSDKHTVMIPHSSIDSGTTAGMISRDEKNGDESSYNPELYTGDEEYLYTYYYAENDESLSNLACYDYSGGSLSEVSITHYGVEREYTGSYDFMAANPSGYGNRIMVGGHVQSMHLHGDKCALLYSLTSTSGYLKVWDFNNQEQPEEYCSFEINTDPSDVFINDSSAVVLGAHGVQDFFLDYNPELSKSASVENLIGSHIVTLSSGIYSISISESSPTATEKMFLSTKVNLGSEVTGGSLQTAALDPVPENSFRDAASQGNYIFIANSEDGIYIIDMSAPDTPLQIGHISAAVSVSEVEIRGNYLFAAESSMIRVYDVSNLSSPVELSSFAVPDYVYDMILSGERLYIGVDDYNYLPVWDISDPGNPEEVIEYNLPFDTSSLCLSGTKLCVLPGTTISSGDPLNPLFCIIDTASSVNSPYTVYTEFTKEGTDPDPTIAREFIMGSYSSNRYITSTGDFVFISGRSSIISYNIKDIERPYLTGGISTYNATYDSGYYPHVFPVSDKLLYPAYGYLDVVDY